jgi:hypothetical protein
MDSTPHQGVDAGGDAQVRGVVVGHDVQLHGRVGSADLFQEPQELLVQVAGIARGGDDLPGRC